MAKPRKTLKQSKIKKKRWFTINSPKLMGEKPIGESYLSDINAAVGRNVTVNLMQLTGDMKSQSASVKFQITGVQDNKLITKICGYNFSPATIKRFVRRRMTRVDLSLMENTKDGVAIRIKPFLLTREKVSRSVEHDLRAKLKEELIDFVKQTPYEELFNMIIKHRLQKELKTILNKIYPVKNIQIRVLEKIGSAEPTTAKPVVKEAEVKEETVEKEVKKEEEKVEEVKEEKPVEEPVKKEKKEEISETKVPDKPKKKATAKKTAKKVPAKKAEKKSAKKKTSKK